MSMPNAYTLLLGPGAWPLAASGGKQACALPCTYYVRHKSTVKQADASQVNAQHQACSVQHCGGISNMQVSLFGSGDAMQGRRPGRTWTARQPISN